MPSQNPQLSQFLVSKSYGELLRTVSIAEACVTANKVFQTPLFVPEQNTEHKGRYSLKCRRTASEILKGCLCSWHLTPTEASGT